MSSINKVILIGNVGKDPEIRSTQSGSKIANLSLATSERWKDKQTGERREKTEWHRVVVFSDGLVRVIENYVKKGSKIYVEGQLQTRKWQDQSGNDRYLTEIVLQAYGGTITLLDSRKDNDSSQDQGSYDAGFSSGGASALDDEIPF